MKKYQYPLTILILGGLILSACSFLGQSTQAPAAEPNVPEAATEAPAATEAAGSETVATQPAAEQPATEQPSAGSTVQHTTVPASPPASGGEKWGDQSTISSNNPDRALLGDRFTLGKFERPYNANTMDVYFPNLDIDHIVIYPADPIWVYTDIGMVGRNANDAFSGQYAIELDLDRNGYGELLIMVDNPASADWTTDGVHVYKDSNGDVGGVKPVIADTAGGAGDGYETVLFDQGSGDDADLAWVRLDPNNPNGFQIAFKQSLLGGVKKYTAGIWSGSLLDPLLFDYNDHFTHEQAGTANREITNFYPIKGISEMDNTCREAIGYPPTGLEPGLCTLQTEQ